MNKPIHTRIPPHHLFDGALTTKTKATEVMDAFPNPPHARQKSHLLLPRNWGSRNNYCMKITKSCRINESLWMRTTGKPRVTVTISKNITLHQKQKREVKLLVPLSKQLAKRRRKDMVEGMLEYLWYWLYTAVASISHTSTRTCRKKWVAICQTFVDFSDKKAKGTPCTSISYECSVKQTTDKQYLQDQAGLFPKHIFCAESCKKV